MKERIAAGTLLNAPFRGRLADKLPICRPRGPRGLGTKWLIQYPESQITFRSTCPLLISPISTVKLYFPFQRACLKRRWALAPLGVLEGVNMTVLQENSSLWLPGAENRTGLSCIPAHLPTCFSSSGALYLHSVCPTDGTRPEPQRWSHQRASNTRGQTNCKRPSYINGAKVLCFIWTCLALFVCAPHSFVLGEILSTVFSSHFKYASRRCQDI